MPFWEYSASDRATGVANASLIAKQFYAVKAVANSTNPPSFNVDVQGAANAIYGILQDNPVSGQACCIQIGGITPVAISASAGTITGGVTYLQVDGGAATGTLIPVAAGQPVALAVESLATNTAIGIISARLLPSAAAQ